MRRLLLLLCAVMMLAVPSLAQDDGSYPEPSYPQPTPEPALGYGTFIFQNWTEFDVDFIVDGVSACRAYVNSTCTTQATPGRHYLTGRLVTDPPRETSESIDLEDGATVTWEVKGGGSPAAGASYPAGPNPQPTGYGMIEIKNYSAFQLDAYGNGAYLCRAEPSSSCSAQVPVGTYSVTVRTLEATPRESPATSVEVADGGTSSVEFSGGGNAPTGYGTIEIKNYSAFQLDGYVDGAYLCRAEPSSSCSAQAGVGTHSVIVRTVEATPRESPPTSIEVVDGGTSTVEYSGGGNAPTGYGIIELQNGTAFPLDAYVDGTYLCRVESASSCSGQASVGTHAVSVRTVEATPRESASASVEVVEGGTSTIEFNGGGEPVIATGQGTVMFDNQSMYIIDFYIDGLAACRAQAANACSAEATVGTHKVMGRTVGEPSFEVAGLVEVGDGAQTVYAVANAAGAIPAPPSQPQPSPAPAPPAGTGNVAFQNLMNATVDFYIDGHFLCRAPAQQSCLGIVPPGGGASVTIRPAAP